MKELKAADLRIGNLYRYLHEESESIRVVDIEFLKTQQLYDIDPDDEIFCRGWWVDSIPLTDEWMEKFNFTKATGLYTFYDGSLELCFYDGLLNIVVEGQWMPLNHIKSVHQLQNIYHSLTGQELTLK